MVRFWEGSRSSSGFCGSRNFLKKDHFKKLWMDFDEIFRKCPKWEKELLMVGFESSGIEFPWQRPASPSALVIYYFCFFLSRFGFTQEYSLSTYCN